MNQSLSPFKFLDSYQKADSHVFFGREKETHELYNALSGVKHLLVYGPSGSGKTSLVECGLRNQFSDADWFAITIRRGSDINAAVFASINNALIEKIETDPATKMPVDHQIEFGQAVERLFTERYQPVYLLFDQFEELLISGDPEEKKKFFTLLNKLIRNKVPCRIMLIMREEFIGHLSEFEQLCPSIFQYRFRVEKMGRKNVEEVIHCILEAPHYRTYFNVTDSQKLAESILSKLPDKKKEIELAHVQVFLGELWDRAQSQTKNNELPVLRVDLIHIDDDLEGVLESFLKKQMNDLENDYGERIPLELLAAMISEKFTKLQLSGESLQKDLKDKQVVSKKPISDLLKELEQRRIIRTLKAGDEIQYEISHDVLALVVGQNLTEEMKMREKANDIFKVYCERQGLFTQDDIDYLAPFQRSLSYPPVLEKRIEASIAAIKQHRDEELARKEKQRKSKMWLKRIAVFASFLIAAIILVLNDQKNDLRRRELKKQNMLHLGENASKQGDLLKELLYTAEALTQTKNTDAEKKRAYHLLPVFYVRGIFIVPTDPWGASFDDNSSNITIWNDSITSYTWSVRDTFVIIDSSKTLKSTYNNDKISPVYHLFNKWDIDTISGDFKVVDMENWNDIRELKIPGSIKLIDGGIFSSDKKLILIWGQNSDSVYAASIFDAETGKQISTPLIHTGNFYSCTFDKTSNKILSWSEDSTVRLWQKIDTLNPLNADLDYPADLFKLQTKVLTGVELDKDLKEIKSIPVHEWETLFYKWVNESAAHFKKCRFPEYNYWHMMVESENNKKQKSTNNKD